MSLDSSKIPFTTFNKTKLRRHHHNKNNNFANTKAQCLGKRDKSSAGRIDPYAVEICAVINAHNAYYTTSSCAGRCFLYKGQGCKKKSTTTGSLFTRYRVSHDCIRDAARYFDLTTLDSDPTGGGDPVRSIGQFEHAQRIREMTMQQQQEQENHDAGYNSNENTTATESSSTNQPLSSTQGEEEEEEERGESPAATSNKDGESTWLRFEPFILHVACRSLAAASALMAAARPSFKNVGLTTWTKQQQQRQDYDASSSSCRYLVAIWGDEGLEMPLSTPKDADKNGAPLFTTPYQLDWLATLVNERHERNWNKIDRFVQAVRDMPAVVDDLDQDDDDIDDDLENVVAATDTSLHTTSLGVRMPRSFDVVGDVAVLHTLSTMNVEQQKKIGEVIMKKNKAIKLVVLRQATMEGTERSPGTHGFTTLAGTSRSPLITTHNEHGIKCVVDLERTFFSPRMGAERLRICQQVARGEHVLVLFCGVGMDAMQIAGRTEASSVVAVELNEMAIKCARLGHRMLERNKAVKCVGAAERLEIVRGNVLEILPTLPRNHFDRVLAPRPKEGSLDGDLGNGQGGLEFLQALLPVLKQDGGECHWYEFVADHEFPTCSRSHELLRKACAEQGLSMEVIHVANAGSVAMRQLRVCIDFRVFPAR